MAFFTWLRNLFVRRSAVHDDSERVPCAQCRLDELSSNPDVQRSASNVRGTAPDRRSAAFGSSTDIIVACDCCRASVAIDQADYYAARCDNAEILCPVCGERAARDRAAILAAASYGDQAAIYDCRFADEIVPVVLDLPPIVVIDELPIVNVGADLGCPRVVDDVVPSDFGGAGAFGGGGADGTWSAD